MRESLATRPSLMVRLRDARDAVAWGEFVELYAPLIHRFCIKKGLQEADAADMTQNVLTQVFRVVPRFEYDPRRGSFRGWLFTTVRNRLGDFFAEQRRRLQTVGAPAEQHRLEEIAGQNRVDEAQWEQEYRRQLYAAAARVARRDVTEKTWRAFTLAAVEGKPAATVAAELGLNVAAVYLAKSRVMARIKAEILQLEQEPNGGPSE